VKKRDFSHKHAKHKNETVKIAQNCQTVGNVIRIDNDRVRRHLDKVVRDTVKETLNGMLEAEADQLCNAARQPRRQVRA
jgi:hypothetical protein